MGRCDGSNPQRRFQKNHCKKKFGWVVGSDGVMGVGDEQAARVRRGRRLLVRRPFRGVDVYAQGQWVGPEESA